MAGNGCTARSVSTSHIEGWLKNKVIGDSPCAQARFPPSGGGPGSEVMSTGLKTLETLVRILESGSRLSSASR